jgi:hypothetical protein
VAVPDPRFDWLSDLPLTPGPPDLRMGLRALDPERWLMPDDFTESELRVRAALLDEHGPTMVRALPGGDDAVREMAEAVAEFLDASPPDPARSAVDHLSAVGRLVPEDLYLLVPDQRDDGARWTLVAGVSVFANQFQLDKILGGSPATIHGPIDGYDELLADRVDVFFDNLDVGRMAWRRNWFLHDSPDYYQPGRMAFDAFDDPAGSAALFVRSEYETLRKLPETGAVVFTVKTQIAPMTEVAARPTIAEGIAAYLEEATPRGLRGKDAEGRDGAVIAWLRNPIAS